MDGWMDGWKYLLETAGDATLFIKNTQTFSGWFSLDRCLSRRVQIRLKEGQLGVHTLFLHTI